jgi:hypothetical protein
MPPRNHLAKHRSPQDALSWRVIDFLGANPGERLTRSDVVAKFGVKASTVDDALASAVAAGQLIREVNDEDGVVWRLRYRAAKFPAPFSGTLAAARKAVRARRKPPVVVDFASIKIESGVAVPALPKKGSNWNRLFDRMAPGQSFELPLEARDAASHARHAYRSKRPAVVLSVRKVSDTTVRVYRTA